MTGRAIIVRSEPVEFCQTVIWYLVTAWEPYDATHRAVFKVDGLAIPHLGQVGTARHNRKIKAEDADERLNQIRQVMYDEWTRAKNVIDRILTDHGIVPDEQWSWVPECAYYRVMKVQPPFAGMLKHELPPLSARPPFT